jgi:hypothetical protein
MRHFGPFARRQCDNLPYFGRGLFLATAVFLETAIAVSVQTAIAVSVQKMCCGIAERRRR